MVSPPRHRVERVRLPVVFALVVGAVAVLAFTRFVPGPDEGVTDPAGDDGLEDGAPDGGVPQHEDPQDRAWLSGSAGPTVVDGSLEQWRGSPVEIAGYWADSNEGMVELWQLRPGEKYADWPHPMDVAIGAIDEHESWAEAAGGAYDDRWREALRNLADLRGDVQAPTYLRFAHESNGDWYPWRVDAESAEDFVASWRRFRSIQLEEYPDVQLVFNVNSESVGSRVDWRETFPGSEHVDVFSVDYYNQHPWVNTREDWEEAIEEIDDYGAPKGLEQHRRFAEDAGLPLAISEWSNNARKGDAPVFMEQLHAYLQEHAGDGPGEVIYEIHFNIDQDHNAWAVYPNTRMPRSAEVYRRLW
jgi:hypothetical protein